MFCSRSVMPYSSADSALSWVAGGSRLLPHIVGDNVLYLPRIGPGSQAAISRARVTFSAECGTQTVMNAGLILMLMLAGLAFAYPDAAHGALLGAIAILFTRRL
jgi:hypothetical protein